MGGPVEHLIAKGPISKYSQGMPAVSGGPIPEMLKNYMDVSAGCGVTVGRGPGRWPLRKVSALPNQPLGCGGGASTQPRPLPIAGLSPPAPPWGLHSPGLSCAVRGRGGMVLAPQ